MAEISTIARPYAEALFQATQDSKDPAVLASRVKQSLDVLSEVVPNPEVATVIEDPKGTVAGLLSLFNGFLPKDSPQEIQEFLKLVIENNKVPAIPEIAQQFTKLLNQAKGEAEVLIESAFPLSQDQIDDFLKALGRKFPGIKLLPTVVVDKSLIGGVRVKVGDQALDGTVKSRLAEMQAALTR